uniref:Small ribosomal subunit protein uS7 domain-containing protein n=1 Tax=Lactuca sativa TaxID=4236 RepID=A0A9R1VZN5_LACSA|nr:hypothetical protein LSAT_V11C400209830 [Lactuca sativa]
MTRRSSLEKMIRVAAGRQWNGIIRELHGSSSPITPLFLQQFSTTSQSKVAYTGSEILNYMGGLDGDEKQLIHKLVNFRMKEGKKTRVRAIFHETLHKLARTDRDAVKLISEALENVKPICEVAKVRIAGNIYDVPGVVARDRQQTLAVRWILDAAKKRRTNHSSRLEECLSAEIMDAYRKRGTAPRIVSTLSLMITTFFASIKEFVIFVAFPQHFGRVKIDDARESNNQRILLHVTLHYLLIEDDDDM